MRALPSEPFEDRGRFVGRLIVDDDDFEVAMILRQQRPHARLDLPLFVARRHDDREARQIRRAFRAFDQGGRAQRARKCLEREREIRKNEQSEAGGQDQGRRIALRMIRLRIPAGSEAMMFPIFAGAPRIC